MANSLRNVNYQQLQGRWAQPMINTSAPPPEPLLCIGGPLDRKRFPGTFDTSGGSVMYAPPLKAMTRVPTRPLRNTTITTHRYHVETLYGTKFLRHSSVNFPDAVARLLDRYEKKPRRSKKDLWLAGRNAWLMAYDEADDMSKLPPITMKPIMPFFNAVKTPLVP